MAFKKEEIIFEEKIPFAMYETNARQVMIHSHDCLEINLILEGTGHYIIENQTYPICPEDLFIINNAEHHMAVHNGDLTMLVFVFTPEFVCSSPEEAGFLDPFFERNRYFSNTVDKRYEYYGQMTQHLQKIAEEYNKRKEGWELLVRAHLLMVLAYLNRYYLGRHALAPGGQQNRGYSRLRGVVEYIHSNYEKEMSLAELAEQAAMSKSYFSFYFTNTMKIRVFDYIEQVRVNHAAMLLKTTDQSVLEIALQSGFHSSAYFNRVFKKVMDMTPGAYRKSKDRTIL